MSATNSEACCYAGGRIKTHRSIRSEAVRADRTEFRHSSKP